MAVNPDDDKVTASYNPVGALNGQFAPAYIPGYAPAEQAVAAWKAARPVTPEGIDQLRMPQPWQAPSQERGSYGLPATTGYNDPTGLVDPEALRALAQNLPYDIDARRNAITERLLANSKAKEDYTKAQQPLGLR